MPEQSAPRSNPISREELAACITSAVMGILEYFDRRLEELPRQAAPRALADVLTVADVARVLKTSTRGVRALIRKKKLPAVKLGGHSYRVTGEDLARYLEAPAPATAPPAAPRPREMSRAEFRAWSEKGGR